MKREPLTSTEANARRVAEGRDQRLGDRRSGARRAERPRRVRAQRHRPPTALDAALGARRRRPRRGSAGPASPTSPMSPSTQPARRRQRGQHVDGGAHRIGVGVVAVVDQRRARRRRSAQRCALRAAASPARRPRGRARPRRAGAGGQRARRPRRARCATLCSAGHAAGRTASDAGRRVQRQRPVAAAASACHCACAARRRRRRRARRSARGARRRSRAPQRRERVVGREHRRAVGAERGDRRAPFSRATASTLGHELLVLALRVVDQRDASARRARPGSAISPGWFMPSSTTAARCSAASWRRRSSVSGTPMSLLKLPCGGERGVAVPGAQDRGDHLRHRGLAVAAGDRDQRQVEAARARRRPAAAARPACRRPAGRAGRLRRGRARPAPRRRRRPAWPRKSCASKRSPRSATNRSPARRRARVAVHARRSRGAVADQRARRAAARAPAASVIIVGRHASPRGMRAAQRGCAPRRRRRTGA